MEIEKVRCICGGRIVGVYYDIESANKVIAELEESHKKEVEQLLMKIAGLEKLVETADKIIKQKGGFTIKDIEFGGVKLEGINTRKNEDEKFKEAK